MDDVLKDERPMTLVHLIRAVLRQHAPCAHAWIALQRANWYKMT